MSLIPATPTHYQKTHARFRLRCDEAPDEPPSVSFEKVLKIECNISITTNYMLQGIKDVRPPTLFHTFALSHRLQSLTQKIEKNSPTLGRNAQYTATSRLSRIPSYLTVHMVRFAWRTDIGKKAKIMVRPLPPFRGHADPALLAQRKVKFPTDFDVLDLVTDELKEKMMPLVTRYRELEGERAERRNIRKKSAARAAKAQKAAASGSAPAEGELHAPSSTDGPALTLKGSGGGVVNCGGGTCGGRACGDGRRPGGRVGVSRAREGAARETRAP